VPDPVWVKNPRRAHSASWVSMLRGLTWRSTASSWPLQSRGSWLVMMVVVISWRRVGGCGPLRVDVLRWGRCLLFLVAGLSSGEVRMVTASAVMSVTAWGRWSPWLR
jgi:hypothetical protein